MRRGLYLGGAPGHHPHGPAGHRQELPRGVLRQGVRDVVRALPAAARHVRRASPSATRRRRSRAIRALAPVVVIVDESDQAEGGNRDSGRGDSGVTERMRASAFNFWADNSLRGRVLRIDSTNRVDLIDSAMRRSGPHRHQDPDPHAGRGRRGGRSSRCVAKKHKLRLHHHRLHAVREAHARLHGQRHRARADHRVPLRAARRRDRGHGRPPDRRPRRPAARRRATRPPSTR